MRVFADWGTSNLRAWLVDGEGRVAGRYGSGLGLKAAGERGFAAVFGEVVGELGADAGTPALISGMAGSRMGWIEVPYAEAPVDAEGLAGQVRRAPGRAETWMVGGVCCGGGGDFPEVMRGEEIQALGVLRRHPDARTLCLPGTHSKWIAVREGKITGVSTFMTGELFEWVTRQSIVASQIGSREFDGEGFAAGLELAEADLPLARAVFQLRTRFLFGKVSADQVSAMASGLLIGHEVAAMAGEVEGAVHFCAAGGLAEPYRRAFGHFGLECVTSDPEEVTLAGLLGVWQHLKS